MRDLADNLSDLASLDLQRRYIIHATRDEYLLPEDVLNDAYDAVRQIRTLPRVQASVPTAAADAILALEPLLDAVVLPPDRNGLQHLVEQDLAWRAAREQAARCLAILGFDLSQFEHLETNNQGKVSGKDS